jgi:hypothetical protein
MIDASDIPAKVAASHLRSLASSKARTRALTATAVGAACVCAAWAVWPLSRQAILPFERPAPPSESSAPHLEAPPLNLAAFDAPLWREPVLAAAEPVPPSAPPPPPPPPPLKLQLLGIVGEPSGDTITYRAALYDPDSDRIIVVTSGDTVAGRTVTTVEAGSVALALGTTTHTLLLRPDRPPAAESSSP